ncbi:MAG: hypothetical protein R2695_01870 [Acidimicrobiales bacterium]
MFGVDRITGWPLLGIHLTLTVIVSALSFHFVEQPFVQRRWPFTHRPLRRRGVRSAAAAVIVILGGLLVAQTRRPPEITERVVFVDAGPAEPEATPDGSVPPAAVDRPRRAS